MCPKEDVMIKKSYLNEVENIYTVLFRIETCSIFC